MSVHKYDDHGDLEEQLKACDLNNSESLLTVIKNLKNACIMIRLRWVLPFEFCAKDGWLDGDESI